MKKLGSILRLEFLPASTDVGLLVLRLWLGLSLFLLHGWTKLSTFQQMAGKFPDPLGVGHRNSLTLAVIGEVLCTILVALGLFTRFAALGSAITMGVAFFMANKMKLSGNGELAFIYLAGFIVILVAGPGKFAIDAKGGGGGGGAAKKPKPAKD